MQRPSSASNEELFAALSAAVQNERAGAAEVIARLAELDRRKLYLEVACSSLYAFCMERLGYSEDGALKRVRVARLAQHLPQVLDELGSGAIHLTGLFLLSQHLTEDNAEALLAEARGKSRRQIEQLLARWFPRPDVPERVEPILAPASPLPRTCPGQGEPSGSAADGPRGERPRVEPLSVASYRIELTISAELYAKLEQLKNLVSHAVSDGDLAHVLERAVDAALERETRRRMGVIRRDGAQRTATRKRRAQKPGSRHIPVEVERAVRERDGERCTFFDEHGRRCSETRFLTIEHDVPYAFGGPPTVDNCRLLCAGHNAYTARLVFGQEHIERKIAQARQGNAVASPETADRSERARLGPALPRRVEARDDAIAARSRTVLNRGGPVSLGRASAARTLATRPLTEQLQDRRGSRIRLATCEHSDFRNARIRSRAPAKIPGIAITHAGPVLRRL